MVALFAAAALAYWLGRESRDAGYPILTAQLPAWWSRPWLAFAILHADLAYAALVGGRPFELSILRPACLVVAIIVCRQLSTVTVYERGVGVQNCLLPWIDLWSRLQRIEGRWYLVLDTIEGRPLNSRFAIPDSKATLDQLRKVRALAILAANQVKAEEPV